ncbi:MAG: hypothetical protein KEFWMYNX_000227 [Candidatus Fervidibacter sp.]
MNLPFIIADGLLLALTLLALGLGMRLYALLRAGEVGQAWRFVILGIILLMLKDFLRLGDQLGIVHRLPLWERIAEAGFLVLLCYALWRQWVAFDFRQRRRPRRPLWLPSEPPEGEQEAAEKEATEGEWRWRSQ